MEAIIIWMKSLPTWLADWVNILLVSIVFITAFTLVLGVWIGYAITRRRMNAIVELQFFPPKITFKETEATNKQE